MRKLNVKMVLHSILRGILHRIGARRHWFWRTMPNRTLLMAFAAHALTGALLTLVGIPGLTPLPGWQLLFILAYASIACLGINDTVKVLLIKWLIPAAV